MRDSEWLLMSRLAALATSLPGYSSIYSNGTVVATATAISPRQYRILTRAIEDACKRSKREREQESRREGEQDASIMDGFRELS